MDIYLDNAATTKTSERAIEKIIEMSRINFGNPSSVHKLGLLAEREITKTRQRVANILNAKEDEIYFTSGATEANNLAIMGCVSANSRSGKHIITQKTEHASVYETMQHLQLNGYEISYLQNDENGQISIEELERLITDETILVSLMHVNNETGAILDIEKIGKIIKQKNKNTLFHSDCVQSFCKFDLDVIKFNLDLCSFSGHKLHSPKGVGGLFIKKGVKINPRTFGGSQEKKLRPGTENIIGITAFGESIIDIHKNMNENFEHAKMLKQNLMIIKDELDDVYINVGENSSPFIANISIKGVKGEVLVHALEEENIYCSTGSACHKGAGSAILTNYGLPKEIAESAIRISFDAENTIEEIQKLKEKIKMFAPVLRRFVKR